MQDKILLCVSFYSECEKNMYLTTDPEQQPSQEVGISERPEAPEQALGVSEYMEAVAAIQSRSHDCSGPWSGYPHCEGKMAVREIAFE